MVKQNRKKKKTEEEEEKDVDSNSEDSLCRHCVALMSQHCILPDKQWILNVNKVVIKLAQKVKILKDFLQNENQWTERHLGETFAAKSSMLYRIELPLE